MKGHIHFDCTGVRPHIEGRAHFSLSDFQSPGEVPRQIHGVAREQSLPQHRTLSGNTQIEIMPEMIEAGMRVLWDDPFLNCSPGQAETLAERVISDALEARRQKILSDDRPCVEPERNER